ncbi:PIN domain-containing protein [Bacillus cereus]|uniref:PIN domain-containing protein n=1 Tax=Bacillus cereus TaxID=1396 RepID=UPI000BFC18A5|nr:PIN domain-containing protein [Bacillus cereus]PGW22249.1 hypothetical protein COD88_28170 [Bacillus cereus]
MNIFIDSNILYRDPFLTKGYNKVLNSLAKHEDVTLFISKAVYMEVLRGHKAFLEEQLKTATEIQNKLTPYLLKHKHKFIIDAKLEDFLQDFEDQYQQLQKENKLRIIDFDKDVLHFVMETDMYEKSPFIKKNEIKNKGGEIIPFKKKEIRDAIIWYSYKTFIQKNGLEDCYFISNNTNEFGDKNAKNVPENAPYTLHPELNENIAITPYKSIKGFLIHNDWEIKLSFKELEDRHSFILSENLSEKIKEELDNGFANTLINRYFIEPILSETQDFLSEKQPEDIHSDYFMGGYIDSDMGDITKIQVYDIEFYGGEIIITVDIELDMHVDVYLYNPVHDSRDDKHEYYATDIVKVEASVVFVIPINIEKEINEESFSFEEYIDGFEPDNLNIEFIQWTNIEHKEMFPEDYDY